MTGFSTKNTIGSKVPNLKDKIDLLQKSGVYRIDCGDCDKYYIGQTRRSFEVRMNEHLNFPDKSNFASHLFEQGHDPGKSSLKVIALENNFYRLNVRESFEINKFMRRLPNRIIKVGLNAG